MVAAGSEPVRELRVGELGVRQVRVGEVPIYTREGGYVYIELNTKEN